MPLNFCSKEEHAHLIENIISHGERNIHVLLCNVDVQISTTFGGSSFVDYGGVSCYQIHLEHGVSQ